MKKLKDLLKESYVWERKFGEKLPTLASIQKKKNEGKLNEKRELPSNGLQKISKLTDRNNHTEARRLLSSWMGDHRLSSFYEAMGTLNKVFQGYPSELQKLMKKMEKQLYKSIKRSYANAEEIIGLL